MQRQRNEIDESNEFLSFPMEYPNPQPPQTDAELLQLVRFIVQKLMYGRTAHDL